MNVIMHLKIHPMYQSVWKSVGPQRHCETMNRASAIALIARGGRQKIKDLKAEQERISWKTIKWCKSKWSSSMMIDVSGCNRSVDRGYVAPQAKQSELRTPLTVALSMRSLCLSYRHTKQNSFVLEKDLCVIGINKKSIRVWPWSHWDW